MYRPAGGSTGIVVLIVNGVSCSRPPQEFVTMTASDRRIDHNATGRLDASSRVACAPFTSQSISGSPQRTLDLARRPNVT